MTLFFWGGLIYLADKKEKRSCNLQQWSIENFLLILFLMALN